MFVFLLSSALISGNDLATAAPPKYLHDRWYKCRGIASYLPLFFPEISAKKTNKKTTPLDMQKQRLQTSAEKRSLKRRKCTPQIHCLWSSTSPETTATARSAKFHFRRKRGYGDAPGMYFPKHFDCTINVLPPSPSTSIMTCRRQYREYKTRQKPANTWFVPLEMQGSVCVRARARALALKEAGNDWASSSRSPATMQTWL